MSNRLKQIWSGFEHQTTRTLTGHGVDDIHVPSRREWRANDTRFLADDFEAPADRAFSALEYKLEMQTAQLRKKGKRNTGTDQFGYGQRSRYAAESDAAPHGKDAQLGAGDPRQALLASLQATDFRVLRREITYNPGFSGTGRGKGKKRLRTPQKPGQRKKFLGLF
ncbi:MAG: hypothetical protein AAFR20_03650 [Pseudomonadota bacterium]